MRGIEDTPLPRISSVVLFCKHRRSSREVVGVSPGFTLSQAALPDDVLKHVSPRHILHCDGQILGGQEHLRHGRDCLSVGCGRIGLPGGIWGTRCLLYFSEPIRHKMVPA